ncbi:MAG: hypothetical protein J0I06_20790 [Planctomycetes bacterium]|nr:hypothetical protein [Planctomycetota bacterium]
MNESEHARVGLALVDLNELLTEITPLIAELVGDDIAVSTELAPGLDPIECDRRHIAQAVLNLVANSRDAMPRGGRLVIRSGSATVLSGDARYPDLAGGRYVSLTVADAGCGMTDEVKAHAFEPFFTTKEFGKGTGLGLPFVLGVVRSFGGDVAIESTVGVGTTVEMLFPPGDADIPIVVLG